METTFDITGIDKDLLLQRLWENSISTSANIEIGFNLAVAKKQLRNLYPEYICGRPIKVDIYNGNQVDSFLYDRDNGEGAFGSVLTHIKTGVKIPKKFTEEEFLGLTSHLGAEADVGRQAFELYRALF